MKTLFFECHMGAAGDMLMGALLELHNNPKEFLNTLNGIGIPNVVVSAEPSVKCGITGTRIRVAINGQEEESADHHEHDHSQAGHDHRHEHEHEHEHTQGGHDHDHSQAGHHHHEHDDHHSGSAGSYHGIEHIIAI